VQRNVSGEHFVQHGMLWYGGLPDRRRRGVCVWHHDDQHLDHEHDLDDQHHDIDVDVHHQHYRGSVHDHNEHHVNDHVHNHHRDHVHDDHHAAGRAAHGADC